MLSSRHLPNQIRSLIYPPSPNHRPLAQSRDLLRVPFSVSNSSQRSTSVLQNQFSRVTCSDCGLDAKNFQTPVRDSSWVAHHQVCSRLLESWPRSNPPTSSCLHWKLLLLELPSSDEPGLLKFCQTDFDHHRSSRSSHLDRL